MGNTAAWDEIGAKVDFPCFYSLEAALRARKRKIDSWGGVLLPLVRVYTSDGSAAEGGGVCCTISSLCCLLPLVPLPDFSEARTVSLTWSQEVWSRPWRAVREHAAAVLQSCEMGRPSKPHPDPSTSGICLSRNLAYHCEWTICFHVMERATR